MYATRKPIGTDALTMIERDDYHSVMCMVNTDFKTNPPAFPAQAADDNHYDRKRSDDDIFQLFIEAANSPNPPSWLPDIAYSVVRYAEKNGKITEGQWKMMRNIYVLLCWTGQLYDPRYEIIELWRQRRSKGKGTPK